MTFSAWIRIEMGTISIETGVDAPHYAPDVMRDAWTQAIAGLKETVETAVSLGVVEISESDDDADSDSDD